GRAEGRVLDHVGIEGQGRLHAGGQGRHADAGVVGRRAGAGGGAQQLLRVRDLQRVTRISAVVHDRRGQGGDARLAGRINGRARVDDQVQRDGRHAVARRKHYLQPVRQGRALHIGEDGRGHGAGRRHALRAVHAGRRGRIFREGQDAERVAAVPQPALAGGG